MRARDLLVPILLAMPMPLLGQRPSAGSVRAPDGQARRGFWIGLGAGPATAACRGCGEAAQAGVSGYLRMGGTLSEHLRIGGETNLWTGSQLGTRETLGFLTADIYWFPDRAIPLFVKVGVGAMQHRAATVTATAAAGTTGLGYELRVTRTLSLVPFLNALVSSAESFAVDGHAVPASPADAYVSPIHHSLVQAGFGLTWH